MVVYSFYIFDRHTECIYSKYWTPRSQHSPATRSDSTAPLVPSLRGGDGDDAMSASTSISASAAATTAGGAAKGVHGGEADKDNAKLIFGTVFSLRNMARKLGGSDDSLVGYTTSQYRLHFFETATNLRFVLLTDPNTPSMRTVLHQIYINLWVEHVVKNPLAPAEHKGGSGVRSELFEQVLDRLLGSIA